MSDAVAIRSYLAVGETDRRSAHYSNPFLIAAAVGCAYYLGALLGFALKFPDHAPSALWPPNSILLSALLLTPARLWWVVLLGAFPAHLIVQFQSGVPIVMSFCWFLSNCFEALFGAFAVHRFIEGRLQFDNLKACTIFLLFVVFLAPFLSSFLDAGFVVLYGWKSDLYWEVWQMRFRSNVVASVTLVPAIVLWLSNIKLWLRALSWQRCVEASILSVSLLAATLMVFDWQIAGQGADPSLVYLPLPLLLWAALRFGPGGASMSNLAIVLISIWGAAHGRGPFIGLSATENVESLQLFLLSMSLPMLFLAGVVEETHRKTQTLSDSEARFRTMADTAPALIWMSDTSRLCTFFNKRWLEFTGRALEQETGNGWADGVHPEDLAGCTDEYKKAFDRRQGFAIEYRLRRHDGEFRWISDNGVPRFAADGTFLGYIGSAFDITERKRAEARLRTQHLITQLLSQSSALREVAPALLKAICEGLGWKLGEFWLVQSESNLLTLFSSWHFPLSVFQEFASHSRQFSFAPGVGLPGRVWQNRKFCWITHLALDDNFLRTSSAVRAGLRSAFAFPVLADNQVLGVLTFFSSDPREPDSDLLESTAIVGGQIAQFIERKQAEDALRKSEARFSGILAIAADAIVSVDEFHRIIIFNEGAEKIFGYQKAEVLGRPLAILIPQQSKDSHETYIRAFAASGSMSRLMGERQEIIALRKSGEQFPAEASISRLEVEGQKIFTVVLRDITERKRAEEQLRENEERLRLALQAGRMGVWDWDRRADELRWSSEHFTIMGLSSHIKPTYAIWANRVHPEDLPNVTAAMKQAIVERAEYRCDYRIILSNRAIRWVEARGTPSFDENGECVRVRGLVVDVTERKESEQALRQALAEVQQLKLGLEADNVYLREKLSQTPLRGELSGESERMKTVLEQVRQVAPTEMTVLVLGETGTGKELVARAVYQNSTRQDRPLVKINCSALPAELIESELFGHEKGAFTGAVARQVGRFEMADGGTIFLDEIGDLPLRLQTKLLRVLQEGEFERVGSGKTIKVDVRVIAATNRSLIDEVQRGRFRADLYYRLNVYPIEMPSLRERKEDIVVLAETFLKEAGRRLKKSFQKIPDEVIESLRLYSWPGNVRELENVIGRAAIISAGSILHLPNGWDESPIVAALAGSNDAARPSRTGDILDSPRTLEEIERARIVEVLEQTNWRIEGSGGAAVILGLHPNTLRSRLKKLGISRPVRPRNHVVETTK